MITISPFKIEQVVQRGEKVSFSVTFTNKSADKKKVKPSTLDFVPSESGDGVPKFLSPTDEEYPRGLKTWVQTKDSFSLEPGEKKEVTFDAKIPLNASVGGHYGAVFFATTNAREQESTVGVESSVGCLLLFTVAGEVTRNIQLIDLVVEPFNPFMQGAIKFTTTMINKGNVHEKPRGTIRLTDMFGNTIGEVGVNDQLGNILPDDTRNFISDWVWGRSIVFPPIGLIHANLSIDVGGMENGQSLIVEKVFWLFPVQYIATICVLIGFLLIGICYFLRRKKNKRSSKGFKSLKAKKTS